MTQVQTRSRVDDVRVAVGATLIGMAGVLVVGLSFVNEPLSKALGVGQGIALLYYTIYQGVAAVAMSFLARPLVRRLGPRWAAVVGGAWTAAFLFLMSFTTSLWMLYGLAAGLGLFASIVANYLPPLIITSLFAEKQGMIMGLVMGLGGVGGLVIGLVMPRVMAAGGWPWGLRALAVYVVVLMILPGLFLLPNSLPAPKPHPDDELPASAAPATGSVGMVVLVGALVLFHITQGIYQHMPPVLMERGVDLSMAGGLMSMTSLVIMVASPLIGFAADRFGIKIVVAALLTGYGLAFLGLFAASGLPTLIPPVMLFGIGTTTPFVLGPLLVMSIGGRHNYARNLAWATAALPIGSALGAPIWGAFSDATGSYSTIQLTSAAVAFGLVALTLLARRRPAA